MFIYRDVGNITVHVQPGREFPQTSEFVNAEGEPILFSVEFKNGKAQVSSAVGAYMINTSQATRSRIIVAHA